MTLCFSLILILCATYWPLHVGWLVVPGLFLLFAQQRSWQLLALWSSCLCCGHLWWVALLAYQHMQAPLIGAALLYLILIGWFGGLSTLFWYSSSFFIKLWGRCGLPFLLCFYFCTIGYATPFLLGIKGYPFLNPLLPLIVWSQSGNRQPPYTWMSWQGKRICYLPPPKRNTNMVGRAQQLMMALNRVPIDDNLCQEQSRIIISPESIFPYPLNEQSEELVWWRSVLPKNSTWVFGALWQKNEKKHQAALFLTKKPIIKKHFKHNCVDFFESTNKAAKLTRFLNKLIGWKTEELCPAVQQQGAPNLRARKVLLCSEALYAQLINEVVVLANETWFSPLTQELFFAAIIWRAWWAGCSVIIIAHRRALCFSSSLVPAF